MKNRIISLNHIAIICSNERSVDFYKIIGFTELSRTDRGYDTIVYLEQAGIVLELYIDPKHPPRTDRPEALGLRHPAFEVDDIGAALEEWQIDAEPIRERNGQKYTFIRDPDGQPIELIESLK